MGHTRKNSTSTMLNFLNSGPKELHTKLMVFLTNEDALELKRSCRIIYGAITVDYNKCQKFRAIVASYICPDYSEQNPWLADFMDIYDKKGRGKLFAPYIFCIAMPLQAIAYSIGGVYDFALNIRTSYRNSIMRGLLLIKPDLARQLPSEKTAITASQHKLSEPVLFKRY